MLQGERKGRGKRERKEFFSGRKGAGSARGEEQSRDLMKWVGKRRRREEVEWGDSAGKILSEKAGVRDKMTCK